MKLQDVPPADDVELTLVQRELIAAGLTELVTFAEFRDDGTHVLYIATDAGLWVGHYTAKNRRPSQWRDPGLEVELTPWAEVQGARMLTAGFAAGEGSLTLRLAEPELELSSADTGPKAALYAFGRVCMDRELGVFRRT